MSFLYFAYGSNLLPERLLPRCPSAIAKGRAEAIGFDIDFSKVSTDGSGKATLVEVDGARTPGMLYEISSEELRSLDTHEGLNHGYFREASLIVELLETNQQIEVVSYIADKRNLQLLPYDWYLALVVAGARFHGLGVEHVKRLEMAAFTADPELHRKGRMQALKAFEAHGVTDYHEILSSCR